jgi:hypothetical protein
MDEESHSVKAKSLIDSEFFKEMAKKASGERSAFAEKDVY